MRRLVRLWRARHPGSRSSSPHSVRARFRGRCQHEAIGSQRALALASPAFVPAVGSASVLVVDKARVGTFTQIQAAIDAAREDNTIVDQQDASEQAKGIVSFFEFKRLAAQS
jgi:hypothetical protein